MKNLMQKSKAYYENSRFYEIFSEAEDYEKKVSNYLKANSLNKIVLDAGCGTGKFLNSLEINSLKYIGIDLSKEELTIATKKSISTNSEFINGNLTNINLESNYVDLIVSAWVLGTILDKFDRQKALDELKRVVKNTGNIILIENAEDSEFERIRNRDKDFRTRDYNNWVIDNGFILEKEINTYFEFETKEMAIKTFKEIYGDEIARKIKTKKIEHKINIYKY